MTWCLVVLATLSLGATPIAAAPPPADAIHWTSSYTVLSDFGGETLAYVMGLLDDDEGVAAILADPGISKQLLYTPDEPAGARFESVEALAVETSPKAAIIVMEQCAAILAGSAGPACKDGEGCDDESDDEECDEQLLLRAVTHHEAAALMAIEVPSLAAIVATIPKHDELASYGDSISMGAAAALTFASAAEVALLDPSVYTIGLDEEEDSISVLQAAVIASEEVASAVVQSHALALLPSKDEMYWYSTMGSPMAIVAVEHHEGAALLALGDPALATLVDEHQGEGSLLTIAHLAASKYPSAALAAIESPTLRGIPSQGEATKGETVAYMAVATSRDAALFAMQDPAIYSLAIMDEESSALGKTVAHRAVESFGAAASYAMEHPEIATVACSPATAMNRGATVAHLAALHFESAALLALGDEALATLSLPAIAGDDEGMTVAHFAVTKGEETSLVALAHPELATLASRRGVTVAHLAAEASSETALLALADPSLASLATDDGTTVAHAAVGASPEAALLALADPALALLAADDGTTVAHVAVTTAPEAALLALADPMLATLATDDGVTVAQAAVEAFEAAALYVIDHEALWSIPLAAEDGGAGTGASGPADTLVGLDLLGLAVTRSDAALLYALGIPVVATRPLPFSLACAGGNLPCPLYDDDDQLLLQCDGFTVAHYAALHAETTALAVLAMPSLVQLRIAPSCSWSGGATVAHVAAKRHGAAALEVLEHPSLYTLVGTGPTEGLTVAHAAMLGWGTDEAAKYALAHEEIYGLALPDDVGPLSGLTVAHLAVRQSRSIALYVMVAVPEVYGLRVSATSTHHAGRTVAYLALQHLAPHLDHRYLFPDLFDDFFVAAISAPTPDPGAGLCGTVDQTLDTWGSLGSSFMGELFHAIEQQPSLALTTPSYLCLARDGTPLGHVLAKESYAFSSSVLESPDLAGIVCPPTSKECAGKTIAHVAVDAMPSLAEYVLAHPALGALADADGTTMAEIAEGALGKE